MTSDTSQKTEALGYLKYFLIHHCNLGQSVDFNHLEQELNSLKSANLNSVDPRKDALLEQLEQWLTALSHNSLVVSVYERHEQLSVACENLVKFKDELDCANRTLHIYNNIPLWLLRFCGFYDESNKNSRGSATAIMPTQFIHYALPFMSTDDYLSDDELQLIEPQRVVSGQYKKYNLDYFPTTEYQDVNVDEKLTLSDVNCIERGVTERTIVPLYKQVGDLPLYYACEGKNRVSIFKSFRKTMFAFVSKAQTPTADDIKLVKLKPFNVWGVMMNGQLEILPFSSAAVPVYEAYGVKKSKARWDFRAPMKLRKIRMRLSSAQMRN